jgi:hypothetical protein
MLARVPVEETRDADGLSLRAGRSEIMDLAPFGVWTAESPGACSS